MPYYWGYGNEDEYGEMECTFGQDENGCCLPPSIQILECADDYLSDENGD